MVIQTEIKIGSKYRFVSQNIDEVVTITESPIKNSSGFLEYGARNEDGVYRICFNDELFKLETSDSIAPNVLRLCACCVKITKTLI